MSYGYRKSGDDLAYGDDYRGGGQRWDRERFERTRARSRGPRGGYDSFRYEESDNYGRGKDRFEVEVDDRYESRGGRRFEEDRRFVEEDRYAPPSRRSRPEFLEEDRYESSGREIAPYRQRWDREEEFRGPTRPSFGRRRSSWDAHDRRPIPRYDDEERDLKVSVRVGSPPRSPPRRVYQEEYRYEPEPRRYEPPPRRYEPEPQREEYRDARIVREREIYRHSDSRQEESDSFEEISPPRKEGKRGKTRMPKRLVHIRAITELGYPFYEEDDFYMVKLALGKEQIDEVIKISETYKESSKGTSYSFNETKTETKAIEAPPPPSSHHSDPAPPIEPPPLEDEEVFETVLTKVIENPTPEDYEKYAQGSDNKESEERESSFSDKKSSVSRSKSFSENKSSYSDRRSKASSRKSGSRLKSKKEESSSSSSSSESDKTTKASKFRSKSRSGRSEVMSRRSQKSRHDSHSDGVEEREEESNSIGGPLTLLVSKDRDRRKSRDYKTEIRELENEKKAIVRGRGDRSDKLKEPEYEVVEHRDRGAEREIRLDKDLRDKSRARSRRPSNRLAEAALRTLT